MSSAGYADPDPSHTGYVDFCEVGQNQSPINIDKPTEAVLDSLLIRHDASQKQLQLSETSDSLHFPAGSSVGIDRLKFALTDMFVRVPSEHLIRDQRFDLELQLAHQTDDGEWLFIALLFVEGQTSGVLADLLEPMQPGNFESRFDPDSFLTSYGAYYRYSGSTTYPPCIEGVRWIIFADVQEASREQIDQLNNVLVKKQSRPVQSLGARLVLK